MAEYYTKVEADALFADADHTHNIEDLGGTELEASRVALGAEVSADFDDAYTVDEGFASVKNQLDGKAPINHTHSNYAPSNHTHDYAPLDHSHTAYSPTSHTHTPASLGAAEAAHSHNYADLTHTHAQSEITGLEAALAAKANASAMTAKADLVDGKVPASQLPGYVDDVLEYAAVANFPATGESGKIYLATGTNKSYRWSGSTYVEVAGGVALGETSATAYRGDRGKTAYDHSQNGDVHVTAAQKSSWDSKAAGNHTHTPASIGAAAAVHTHDYSAPGHTHAYADLTGKPTIPTIPASLPANGGNADTVDGKHAADFASNNHTHTAAAVGAMPTSLMFTSAEGGVEYAINTADNKNVLTEALNLPVGVHTVYAQSGVHGNPKHNEAWRFLIHKTGASVLWILGFGSLGSVYTNYYDGTSGWRGWRCVVDANPSPLWAGTYYPIASHTITPDKKLSECRNGWLLIWSDYDPGDGANDGDIVQSVVYKKGPTGSNWSGQGHYFDIPRYIGANTSDVSTESRIIKRLKIYDDKIEGYAENSLDVRTDVVLRAVYEF